MRALGVLCECYALGVFACSELLEHATRITERITEHATFFSRQDIYHSVEDQGFRYQ